MTKLKSVQHLFLILVFLMSLLTIIGCGGGGGGDDKDDDTYTGTSTDTSYTNSLSMTFNLIPTGRFTMGSPSSELGRNNIEAQHEVVLTQSFYMQTTEVTQGQWETVMGNLPSDISSNGYGEGANYPVYYVSWNDVQEFIDELNEHGEGTYRLPTEAEWEYCARAGSTTAFANGGITETGCAYDANLDAMGWYCGNNSGGSAEIGQKESNAWGLYDMHGNLWEWCSDWYGNYSSGSVTDPTGPSSGSFRVVRGGSWDSDVEYCRSALRSIDDPVNRYPIIGFRLVWMP